jgi:peptidoglycan/xylan/chitin deacetylase (PgdA/CDA1 family)
MEQGRRLVAAGHELGNHTYSHERMILVTPSFVRQEVERSDQLIREAGYQGEILFLRTGRSYSLCPVTWPRQCGSRHGSLS